MNSRLDRVRVVLARPEGARNVGAVCRAMKSMGLTQLVLVSPTWFDQDEVYQAAIHAREIYDGAKRFYCLGDALAGTVLSAGITRRRGARRKWFSLLPEELAEKAASLAEGEIALVFGNERTGLSDEELNHCNVACHIPSSPDFPSLNLSHAVQVVAYAFWRRSLGEKTGGYEPVAREEVDHLVSVIHDSLEAMHYFKSADRFHTDRYFRDILARASLSVREARHMEKIFRKLQYLKAPDEEEGASAAEPFLGGNLPPVGVPNRMAVDLSVGPADAEETAPDGEEGGLSIGPGGAVEQALGAGADNGCPAVKSAGGEDTAPAVLGEPDGEEGDSRHGR